ncbi:tetratricopeptide repeat protein [bacterium]|nr:tetratricopeptide repeat protein [bacterium]
MSKTYKLFALTVIAFVSIAILANWVFFAWFLNPNTLYDRALDQVEAGKFAEARVTLAKLKRNRPPTPLDHGLQARVEIAEGQPEAALVELAAIPDDHPLARWARLRSGQLERGQFRFRAAEEYLKKALQLVPAPVQELIEPRRELIYILGMQLRREELHRQFQVLAREAPLSAKEIYVWCLVRDLAWWEASEQVPILEKAVQADPADDRSRVALAEILHRQSETDKALETLADDKTGSRFVAAEKLRIQIDREGPEALDAALSSIPADDPLTATMRGRLALLNGDGPAAVRCFEIALAAEPGRRQVVADLGRALALVGQAERGKARTEQAGRIDALNNLLLKMENSAATSGPEEWRVLARACESAGRLDEARAWFGLVLQKNPLDEESQTAIFRIDNAEKRAAPGGRSDE